MISYELKAQADELFDQALTFEMKGENSKAIETFRKALEIDPEFAEAYNNLGDVLMKQNKIDEAIVNYEKSREIKPHIQNTYFDLGCAYMLKKDYKESLRSFRQAHRMKPEHTEVICNMGYIYYMQGNYEKAKLNLMKAHTEDQTDIMPIYYLGLTFIAEGDVVQAQKMFDNVVAHYEALLKMKKDKPFPEAHYFTGQSLYYTEKLENALDHLVKAVEQDTEEVDYHMSQGLGYSDADAFFAVARCALKLRRNDMAEEYIKKALELEPNNEEFLNLKKEI